MLWLIPVGIVVFYLLLLALGAILGKGRGRW